MLIGELSARTGVSQRLLRYYEEQKLITPGRDANGYRVYRDEVVDVVHRIRELLELGLGTEAIRDLVPCLGSADAAQRLCPQMEAAVRAQLASMDHRIETLARNRGALAGYLPGV